MLMLLVVGCATTPTKKSDAEGEVKIFHDLTEKELNTNTKPNK